MTVALTLVAAAAMFSGFGGGLSTVYAHPGCGDPTHDPGPPDLTPLWISLGILGVAAVLVIIIVIRNKNANKEYKKRQKKKQMKRDARDKS